MLMPDTEMAAIYTEHVEPNLNDGDALFPAIALNPRAALVATVYSAIPALIVAYGFWFFAPGFL